MHKNWTYIEVLQTTPKRIELDPVVRGSSTTSKDYVFKQMNNINNGSKYCPITIHKLNTFALVDTGAEISCMSSKFLRKIPHKAYTFQKKSFQSNLQGVTGTELKTSGTIRLSFRIGKKSFNHKFVIVNNVTKHFILGSDFLTAVGATLDFKHKTISIENHITLLTSKFDYSRTTLVNTCYKCIFPPQTITYVKVTPKNSIRGDAIFEPLDNSKLLKDQPGLTVPQGVSKGYEAFYIPVHNNTYSTFVTTKGQPIGTLEKLNNHDICGISHIEKAANVDDSSSELDYDYDGIEIEHREKLREFLSKNKHMFAKNDMELGRTTLVKAKLDTGTALPRKVKPYRIPFSQRPIVKKHIDDLLKANIISPSQSPWRSPLLLVDKKNGDKRTVVDFRKTLNPCLKQNSIPLPLIDSIFAEMAGAKIFSTMDLKSGFFQIELADKSDKEKTAFSYDFFQLYEFNVLPQGTNVSPGIFQDLMNKVLKDLPFVHCYLDDICVFSKDISTHWTHLDIIMKRLKSAGLRLKLDKCRFLQTEISFLGHKISDKGLAVDPEKISAIKNMPRPKTVKNVRSFVGMCSYFRAFIPNFSTMAKPLTDLTCKNAKFHWTEEQEQAFQKLKDKLQSTDILAHPQLNKEYKLYSDASGTGIGAMLTQQFEEGERVIQYISKSLNKTQQNWPVIEREAYAIVFAVNKLRQYLLGSQFTIYCDHKPLQSLFTAEMKNAKIQRWGIMLSEYGCQIKYHKGKLNIPADTLSRLTPPNTESNENDIMLIDNSSPLHNINDEQTPPEVVNQNNDLTDFFDIKAQQQRDKNINNIITDLNTKENSKFAGDYLIEDGLLYHISKPITYDNTVRKQLVIPVNMTNTIMEQFHNDPYQGAHLNIDRVYDRLRRRFYWHNMYANISKFIDKCDVCKGRNLKQLKIPIQDMSTPNFPFEIMAIDTCGPFPTSLSGNRFALTIIDHYSSWPEVFATKDKSAETVAQILLEYIIPRHSCPRVILSDQGSEFVNRVIALLNEKLHISHVKSSVRHPASNGKVEVFHRYMNNYMAKYVQENQFNWDTYLAGMLFAYRTSLHDSLKHSPFYILYGRDPILPLDTLLNPKLKYLGDDYVPCMLQRMHITFKDVQHYSKLAREKNRARFNKRAKNQLFKIGDPVYYYYPVVSENNSPKLNTNWKPYYRIIEKMSDVNYRIHHQLTGKSRIVHAENLRAANPDVAWDILRDDFKVIVPEPAADRIPQLVRPAEVGPTKVKPTKLKPTRRQPQRAAKMAYRDRIPTGIDLDKQLMDTDTETTEPPTCFNNDNEITGRGRLKRKRSLDESERPAIKRKNIMIIEKSNFISQLTNYISNLLWSDSSHTLGKIQNL